MAADGEAREDDLLSTCLDSRPKLDVALFFHENPDTMDTPGSIATWTGYHESELEGTLDDLVRAGVLRRTGNILRITDDPALRHGLEQVSRYYHTARGAVEELVARLHEDHQRMAEQLERLEVSLDVIVHTMADGLIVTNADRCVVLVNPGAERLLGLGEAERIGRPASEVFAGTPVEPLVARIGDVGPGAQLQTELRVIVGDEARYVRADVRPVGADDGGHTQGHVLLLSDITDLRRLDDLKSELISFVSHELKAPLTAVKGYAGSLLSTSLNLERETQEEFLREIDGEVDRLSRLIDSFLDISKLDAGRPIEIVPVSFALGDLIRQAVQIQLAVSNRCIPTVEVPEDLGSVTADRDKVLQVLTNLLSNAVKYSPAGRPVVVSAERLPGAVRVHVTDRGLGMSPEQIENMFVPYYRIRDAKRKAIRGTGLGLYLSKHLVEAHGGQIGCESEEGVGSTFWFTIPDARPQEASH